MALNTSQIQIQKQILAPTMQQSIEVLMLPIIELNTAIDLELQENPCLEIDEEKTARERKQLDDIIQNALRHRADRAYSTSDESENVDDDLPDEKPIPGAVHIDDHLLNQLRLETNDPLADEIGELIIGSLDEDGYLTVSCMDIARTLRLDSVEPVEDVLRMIQGFDPIGIASRNLQECLLAQINTQFNGHADLARAIVTDCLDELGRRRYQDIARKLKSSLEDVKHVAKSISHLEPKPARKYQPYNSNIYVKPDIMITKDKEEQFQVQVNNENVPSLRISATYEKILKQPNRSAEETEFIREKIKNALMFIRSIELRRETLKKIAEYILNHQRAFFVNEQNPLKPMILKDVAQAVERNESTVCRAINNKYIQTPHGLYPVKYFFSQAVNDNATGENVASRSVKEEIKSLIDDEDKTHPLSDQAIQAHFENKGMKIARRTISKYRQQLNILPSHLRKI
ncbi:MAG: RNA polymerase factor sigma-54 [Candidatus Omnitrophica bacterium]|nr:RNA polymerase factor sigma-54 [Candidatus Omnitrophota bacterium]